MNRHFFQCFWMFISYIDVGEPLQHPPGQASEETELSRISFQSLLYMHRMSPRSQWGQFFPPGVHKMNPEGVH